MNLVQKMFFFLNRRQKIGAFFLTIMIFIGAILETIGVSVIIPIVQLMTAPDTISDNKYIGFIIKVAGIQETKQLFLFMLSMMILIYVIKNAYLLFLTYVQTKFVNGIKARTQSALLEWYLSRPYEFFLYADASEILRIIRGDVQNIFAILLELMQFLTEILVTVCIGVFLLITDWKMTLFILGLTVVVTLVIAKGLKGRIGNLGRTNQKYEATLTRWVLQSMSGIKIVKVSQKEEYFNKHYKEDAKKQAQINTRYSVYNATPRLLLETVFISGMLLYMMINILLGGEIQELVKTISAVAIAAFRILPSASRFNTYLANLAYYEPSLNTVYDMVQKAENNMMPEQQGKSSVVTANKQQFKIDKEIELKDVTFAYPNTDKKILEHANMVIPIGQSVGIKGPSGAGKTTVVDIILGLLKTQEGEIICNGNNVLENNTKWLSHIGYIPQNVYLSDASIKRNIAFGVEEEQIDEERIWEVLKEAQLESFVKSLSDKIETEVGEQGIRISGGQKQRLGIARALYHNPEILIFDEATSALDNDTETAIMEAVEQFKGKKTLIIIAHRLRTIEQCDMIYEVNHGKIVRER